MYRHGSHSHGGNRQPYSRFERWNRFGRLFPNLPPFEPADEFLIELGSKGGPMDEGISQTPSSSRSIPAGYTFLGQFIDHDITFDPLSSLDRQNTPGSTRNFRTPLLELDSVYGVGRAASPYLYDLVDPAKLLTGSETNPNDLPRNQQGVALIGDPRNDENLFIAQLQVAFLKFHNAIVDYLRSENVNEANLFAEAQRLARWHYQWVVVHDFLPLTIGPGRVEAILRDGPEFYCPDEAPYMPVEFSVAAYRFGHSQVRSVYRLNDQITAELFELPSFSPKPPDLDLDWSNFFKIFTTNQPQFSRKIDTKLASVLFDLPFSPGAPPERRSLAVLNLLRGKAFGLPSGQAVAKTMSATPLTKAELELPAGQDSPLWYYFLKEAEVQNRGEKLGEVGGRIVGEVILGLLYADPYGYLRVDPRWEPTAPFATNGDFKIVDLLQFAGVV